MNANRLEAGDLIHFNFNGHESEGVIKKVWNDNGNSEYAVYIVCLTQDTECGYKSIGDNVVVHSNNVKDKVPTVTLMGHKTIDQNVWYAGKLDGDLLVCHAWMNEKGIQIGDICTMEEMAQMMGN